MATIEDAKKYLSSEGYGSGTNFSFGNVSGLLALFANESIEKRLRWIPIEEKYPICYESGEWDGLRSEEIIFKCKNGDKYIGRFYSGFLDGSEYNDFTDISSFIIPNVTEWRFL